MNRILIIIMASFFSNFIFAQAVDTIYTTKGLAMPATILEIGEEIIKFKKGGDISAPIRTINVVNVHKIAYKNGTIEVFNETSTAPTVANKAVDSQPTTENPIEKTRVAAEEVKPALLPPTNTQKSLPAIAPFKYSPYVANPKQDYTPRPFTTP